MKFKTLLTIFLFCLFATTHTVWNAYEAGFRGKINALQANNSATDTALANLAMNHNLGLYIWIGFAVFVVLIWWKKRD